jgi:sulfate/thiosulfate transport system substrate-binding protein
MKWVLAVVVSVAMVAAGVSVRAADVLKVSSYEPTVELYKALNPAFQKFYAGQGRQITVQTDHGPSGKQARDIAQGKETDVAALSVDFDIDQIAKAGLIAREWRERNPNNSVPYYSAVVFLVRKGNPKGIKDWNDLAREEVVGLAPDPKTGGGARWIYLAAWAHALRAEKAASAGATAVDLEAKAKAFVEKVYDKAVLDPAMRGSTTRFIQQQTGDVLFGWENEILQVVANPQLKGQYELVVPSDSITIEVPIAVVDKVAEKHGLTQPAKDFVAFLFSDEGQEIEAQFYNRPYKADVAAKYKERFAPLTLYKFSDHFKDWTEVMAKHFADGAILDQIRKK